jgi:uncharacterized protein (DUF2062 family)
MNQRHRSSMPAAAKGERKLARYWARTRRLFTHHVLHADDTPHQISMGVAVATFVGFLPILGLQTIVAVAAAAAMRVNKAVCIPVVWISNPLTFVPMYGTCLWVGRGILNAGRPEATSAEALVQQEVQNRLAHYEGWSKFVDWEFWRDAFRTMVAFGAELWVGCILLGFIAAVIMYFLSRWGVAWYREKHRQRILRRNLYRARLAESRVAEQNGSA